MFCRNVGKTERIIRVIVGLVLLALVFVGPQTPWGWIGLIPLITGLLGWCGIYTLLGKRSCKS
ncbi:hypothetical protein L1281_001570 [Neisseria sp. HSC-16F19]|nr:hypothetical protein [Neisseria sp. HSC-16F19]